MESSISEDKSEKSENKALVEFRKDIESLFAIANYVPEGARKTLWNFSKFKKKFSKNDERKINNKDIPDILIQNSNNFEFFNEPYHDETFLTCLDLLFYNDLGWMAEEICKKMDEKKIELPDMTQAFLEIYQGKELNLEPEECSFIFIEVAYRIANQAGNFPMVENLYTLLSEEKTTLKEKVDDFREKHKETYSKALNYIHEPYWGYNIVEIRAYAQRMMEKMAPFFVKGKYKISENGKLFNLITTEWEAFKVRKVPFGYVFPNLYLQEKLKDSKRLGVPRLFIIPKSKTIHFKFKMPIGYQNHIMGVSDTGNNTLEVLTDDFEVYQEYIDGKGVPGSYSFAIYGHRDIGPLKVQSVRSKKDDKEYLVDTKERKNFFVPFFSPFENDYYDYKNLGEEIKNRNEYARWKEMHQKIVYEAKIINFYEGEGIVDITLEQEDKD